jgi:cytochrome c biogenesis protein CcmG/thiol:disulfide interchange protein DsbE
MERHETAQTEQWVNERIAALETPGGWSPDPVHALQRLQERRARPAQVQMWGLAMAAAAMSGGCLLAFPGARAFASRCVDACGQLVWRAPTVAAPGRLAPDFTLQDADGHPVSLSSFRGKTVLLNFWATWCHPCAIEIPWFVEFERSYRDQGLVVLGVSLDEDGWQAVRPFIAERKINYRVLLGGDSVANLFGGIESLPSTFIIDRQGSIAATHLGLASRSAYEAGIKAALAK